MAKFDDRKLDGIVAINTSVDWDFDPSDGIEPGHYDFQAMALQEVAHVMGFISGQDAFEAVTTAKDKVPADKDLAYVAPMDLYRYSSESAKEKVFDLTFGGSKYFSIDSGVTAVAEFSTGGLEAGGDGYQASHWKASSPPLGVMNPALKPGQKITVSDLDLQMLDVIGWNLQGQNFSLTPQNPTIVSIQENLLAAVSQHRTQQIEQLDAELSARYPGYDFSRLLEQSSEQIAVEVDAKAQKIFDDLDSKLQKETDVKKRQKEIQKAEDELWGLEAKVYDKEWEKLGDDIDKAFEKLDKSVEKLLAEDDPKKLAKTLTKASVLEVSKFISRVYDFPADSPKRLQLEEAIILAAEIAADKPQKEVQELLKSAPPNGSPVGWSRFWRSWSWFWQQGLPLGGDGEVLVDSLTGLQL